MDQGLIGIAQGQEIGSQLYLCVNLLRIEFDDALQSANHSPDVARLLLDKRKPVPGPGHLLIVLDGIAEFEAGADKFTLGDEFIAALIMRLGALLRRRTADQDERKQYNDCAR